MPRKFQSIETARGLVYRAQLTDPTTGKRLSITAPSLLELETARRKFREARAGIKAGIPAAVLQPGLPGHLDPRFARVGQVWMSYLASLEARARAKAESYGRRNVNLKIQHHGRAVELFSLAACELLPATMGAWLIAARESGGRDGQGRAWCTIQTAYDYLLAAYRRMSVEPPWRPWRPVRGKPQKRHGERPTPETWDDVRALLAVALREDAAEQARGHYADRGARAVVALCAGLRNAELAGLGWDDLVGLDEPGAVILHVRHQAPKGWHRWTTGDRPTEPPKGWRGAARRRSQILEPLAVEVLRRLREEQRRRGWWRRNGPVFGVARGGKWCWRTAGRAIDPRHVKRWAAGAGLPEAERWVTHCFRHSMVTLSFVSGGDPRSIQHRVGHADISTTMGYYHRMGRGLPAPLLGHLAGQDLLSPALGAAAGPASSLVPPLLGEGATAEPALTEREIVRREPTAEQAAQARRILEAEAERDRARPSFAELADRWVAARDENRRRGKAPVRPPEVTAQARRQAAGAYQRTHYANGQGSKDKARVAWKRAYQAVLARWGRELRAAELRAASHEGRAGRGA